ncbi:hypothetical protein PRNP1_008430 [Phytophthora ramorum]
MYHGATRDHGDKKRQRLTPPPNEVWMEAIMSKGKAPEGYVPVTSGPVVPATAAAAWQGRAPDREAPPPQYQQYSTYQGRTLERSTVYPPQGRVAESLTGYSAQGRMATGYAQARTVDAAGYQGPAGYQGRTTAGYQARTTGFQGRADMYQERVMQQRPTGSQQLPETSTGFKGKMAEDYKRERKLPPRVEEMLREQVNLDESVLHDAFAVAMEDLIPEQEANFVAKGLCHLCGAGESHYVPVVNFCPHADEGHSLCREHLRSVYRVRLEALFVGRNGSAPNRRLLRCLVCTSGCPCTSCTQVKVTEVQKYKRYLLDTLRRNGQGGTAVVKDNRAPPATPTGPDGRISFSGAPNVASSDSHRYAQYPPTPQGDGRAPVVCGEVSARGVEDGRSWEGHRQIPTQQSDYGQYPAGERDSYPPNMQAQQKPLPRYPPLPKRAAKDTPTDMLSVIADSVHAVDPRVAARIASPLVHQGSAESPTAATVLNCAESEKSLVHLLSTLNQDTEPSSMAMDLSASSQSSKDSTHRQVELRYGTNGIVARKESSGYAQDSGDQGSGDEMEASSRLSAERADEEDDEDDEDEGDDSDSELDTNLDFCEVCQGAGDLVCCDKCPRSFHLKCLHMKESDLPEGDWQCAECRKPSRFDLYSTAVASEQGLLDKCLKIVSCLKSHPFSKPFLTPVENIPMYTRVVKQPMDLSTIEDKLKKGAYIVDSNTVAAGVKELDSTHFANDIRLMWSNCKLFNDDGSGITRAADILSAGFERLYKESIEPPLTTRQTTITRAEFPESLLVVSVAMELALDEEGAQVTAVTSYDPNFPPVNTLDGEQSSKWVTTGSFPQELVVQLATTASVVRAKMWTRNVKEVSVEACSGPTPTKWEKLFDAKLKETDGEMQIVSENVKPTDASFIKFRILSGWGDFVQVHRVSVEGSTSRR